MVSTLSSKPVLQKKKKKKKVQRLSSKYKILNSNPSITKKEKINKRGREPLSSRGGTCL
jgi:hypothetical protein